MKLIALFLFRFLVLAGCIHLGCFSLQAPTLVQAHSTKEIEDEFTKQGEAVPEPLKRITRMYEQGKEAKSPFAEQAHAAQHDMLLDTMQARAKRTCVTLIENVRNLDRKIEDLKKAGKTENLDALQSLSDKSHAVTSLYCPTPQ